MKYFSDPSGELSATEVHKRLNTFRPFDSASLQIPRDGAVWLYFTLHNKSRNTNWIIENAMNVELMELYLRKEGAWSSEGQSGNMIPFSERKTATRTPAFELALQSQRKHEVLIKVFDYQSSCIQLTLKDSSRFRKDYHRETLLLGLAFGFFAAFIVYNLIVFFLNRERSYLLYSLYMAAFFLNQFAQERLFAQYIQPEQPYGFFWFIIFGSATAAFGLDFFRHFIGTRSKMPRLDFSMRILRTLAVLLGVSAFFYSGPISADLLNILSIAAMGLIFTVLALRILKRDLLALLCLTGSLLYLAGTAAEIVITLVPVPVTSFALHAQLYGALAQVLFIGFAVGANTYRLRQENERIQLEFTEKLEDMVAKRTQQLNEANRKLTEHAVTDPLTGLFNRGELDRRSEEFDTYFARKTEGDVRYVISAAYIDLDNFKYCNDTFGHHYGDEILIKTADILRKRTRGYDLLFRLGGDEFLVLMPETTLQEASGIVERIRRAIESEADDKAKISASIGLASTEKMTNLNVEQLIREADTALLYSKREGKNRIRFQNYSKTY
ncbi:MAG: sensor domain-containing diguanylate cyclase [Spirochaetales bacterium]|nr:sensor domain-containing diguanylate cyclase [Spirochaetales bacterium]MCF7937431.1 sensor domain-containing diguanylate cyclase [Spirochaetales bacterium]